LKPLGDPSARFGAGEPSIETLGTACASPYSFGLLLESDSVSLQGSMNTEVITPSLDPVRVRIFVDFWNFTLAIGGLAPKPLVDWSKLGPVLAAEAGRQVDPARPAQYEGLHVYGS